MDGTRSTELSKTRCRDLGLHLLSGRHLVVLGLGSMLRLMLRLMLMASPPDDAPGSLSRPPASPPDVQLGMLPGQSR